MNTWKRITLISIGIALPLLGAVSLGGCKGDESSSTTGAGGDGGSSTSASTSSASTAGAGTASGSTGTSGTGSTSGTAGAGGAATSSAGSGGGTSSAGSGGGGGTGGGSGFASPEEQALANLINEYRGQNGLPPVALSPSMTLVAQTHSHDLVDHEPDAPANCNLHSWSDQGSWTACCYTPDHAQAQCMWDKPHELTVYMGNGFEISVDGGTSISPQSALDAWKGSPGHDDVILNKNTWASYPWGAMGVGIVEGHANVWFGVEIDPAP